MSLDGKASKRDALQAMVSLEHFGNEGACGYYESWYIDQALRLQFFFVGPHLLYVFVFVLFFGRGPIPYTS